MSCSSQGTPSHHVWPDCKFDSNISRTVSRTLLHCHFWFNPDRPQSHQQLCDFCYDQYVFFIYQLNFWLIYVLALVGYEHLVTLRYEIDFLWKRKWSSATWIFLTNRYLMLVRVIFQSSPTLPKVCSPLYCIAELYSSV